MSSEQNDVIISNDIIDNSYEINKYIKMIYKQNENKKEKKEIIKKMIDEDGFKFDDEKEKKEEVIKILGKYFVKQNKNKCKIIYNNKKYKLKEYFDEIDINYKKNIKEIKLKLIGIDNITDMKEMFYSCIHLFAISESDNENIQQYDYQYDISSDIYSTLLEDINEINNNIEINDELNETNKNSSNFYDGCTYSEKITSQSKFENNFLSSSENIFIFHQISSANIYKIKNINNMLSGCISLTYLPDLSKLDTSNVFDMACIFNECNSLVSLPDILKWITTNVIKMYYIFNN